MPISIYPPTLKSTQTAFLASTNPYPIYFTLQSITTFTQIQHIQVRVVRQSNNKSIVNTKKYPDGVIYKAATNIQQAGVQYSINIFSDDLAEKWQAGYVYKIQMRFGTEPIFTSVSNFADWKQEQIEKGTFSEWSTVMVVKAISDPEVEILNAESVKQDIIYSEHTEASLTPLFIGKATFSAVNKEVVDQYKFDLYNGETEDLIETSDWLQHNSSVDGTDSFRFKTLLEQNQQYRVIYTIKSLNGFTKSSSPYDFTAVASQLSKLKDVTLTVESNSIYCRENGCINIYASSVQSLTGSYVIIRSSEKTNYQIWEDIKFIPLKNATLDNELIYQDFTIESGVRYKYGFQLENSEGLRTTPVYAKDNELAYSTDFEYCFLYRDGIQLRLQFNNQVSSFKHTVLRAKQDTLGDRYPHLTQNGNAYYAEFPISGLISFHMDDNQTFFSLHDDGYHCKDELVIPRDKFIESPKDEGLKVKELIIDHNLTYDNIFIERIFREKVEEFLNDFSYKLYKSPTEGNIIVGLMNVSLTPNTTLGRMIFNFSATAYEVSDNTLEALNETNIIDIGHYESLVSDEVITSFGQLTGIYGEKINLYNLIKQQEEKSIGDGYKQSLKQITGFWIEYYPKKDFTAEILELRALISQSEDEDQVNTYEKQIAEYEQLNQVLSGPLMTTTILNVEGSRVIVQPEKIYSIEKDIGILVLESAIAPIIVNYMCELVTSMDEEANVVSAVDVARIWGQISGVFTGTHRILENYNYNYLASETYRIYNPNPNKMIIYDSLGRVLVDNTNYNVYKSVNIFDIIKQDTQRQVETIYKTEFAETSKGELTDGSLWYEFGRLTLFDIEADEGTALYIGRLSDGSDAVRMQIGPSGRYVLDLSKDNYLVQYIALESPRYCVINYKCLTNQLRKVKQGVSYV